jgi:hypothetical protein
MDYSGSIPAFMVRIGIKSTPTLVFIVFLFALGNLEIPGDTFLTREIQNAMHFPFFGILSLLVLGTLSLFFGKISRLKLYFLAFSITLLVGILHEYSQIIGPRDADISDLLKDAVGGVTFLGLYMIFDKKMTGIRRKRDRSIKILIIAVATLLILSVIAPIALWGGAYLYRNNNFPTICDFESFWEAKFLITKGSVLKTVIAPYTKEISTENTVGKLTFLTRNYPGFIIEEPYPDWSDYESFEFIVFSELNYSVFICIRIEDSRHNKDYSDRFNKTLKVDPGLNDISIPLTEIQRAPLNRELDMMDIRAIHLFVPKPDKEIVLYFDDIRLK